MVPISSMNYGQWCPVARATEILGERWTLLVVRELVLGSTRYGQLQRGLGRISPGILSSRLKTLVDHGIVTKVGGEGGHAEYHLTAAGRELQPILEGLAVWGQRWARSRMTPDELDVEVTLLTVQRYFDAAAFPVTPALVAIVFTDLHGESRRWWLLVDRGGVDVCTKTTGQTEAVKLTCTLRTLSEIYAGDRELASTIDSGHLRLEGLPKVVRAVHRWLRLPAHSSVKDARCA